MRYRKQIEDLQISSRQAHESLASASKEREEARAAAAELAKEVAELKAVVSEITSQLETISAWALGFHALFLVVELGLGFFFLFACYLYARRMPKVAVTNTSASVPSAAGPVLHSPPLSRRAAKEESPAVATSVDSSSVAYSQVSSVGGGARRKSFDCEFCKPFN